MIKPTVGRVVWFYPPTGAVSPEFSPPAAGQPLAAIIAAVLLGQAVDIVNLTVFDAVGRPHAISMVPLVQEGQDVPEKGFYATWMPYQIGQAKKDVALPASTVLPHQQRVIDEKRDLDAKLAKLGAFFDTPIFRNLGEEEKQRLERQEEAMKAYSEILTERIAAFQTANTDPLADHSVDYDKP